MIKKNTYTLAYEACESYFSETGRMPTIETIKPIINVNSPTTISNAIKDWKSGLSQAKNKSQHHNPAIPETLNVAIISIWEQALAEAKKMLDEQIIELQANESELANKEKALRDEATQVQQLVQMTEQKHKEEIIRLNTEKINLTEQNEHHRTMAFEMEMKNAVLNEQIRQEQDKYFRLENQYDKEHEWALKRIEEEKSSYKQHIAYEMDRLKSETLRSKQFSEELQSKLDILTNQMNENQNITIELERKLSAEKLKNSEMAVKEAQLEKELNTKETQLSAFLKKKGSKSKHGSLFSILPLIFSLGYSIIGFSQFFNAHDFLKLTY